MNERIKELRKILNLTQSEFAARLLLSQNFIAQVESGKKNISERTEADICREFNINDEWLRTGTGEMHKPIEDKLSVYVSEITDGDDDFIKDFITVYMELDDTSKAALRKIADGMANLHSKRDLN